LAVGPGVLIPRPETEQMVDWAAEAVAAAPHLAAAPWMDLGTGSGALAVGVACMLQKHCKVGVDCSFSAVAAAWCSCTTTLSHRQQAHALY
jgi:release factor glutamine methyltransferase